MKEPSEGRKIEKVFAELDEGVVSRGREVGVGTG